MAFVEGLLQRMQLATFGQAFNRADLRPVRLHGIHEARAHGDAIEVNRAGAAHALLAADMRAFEPERIAQEIGEAAPGLGARLVRLAIDLQLDGFVAHAVFLARSSAVLRARATSTAATSLRYAEEACRSSVGWRRSPTRLPTACRSASDGVLPTSAPASAAASKGEASTPPNASLADSTAPEALSVTCAPTDTSAKSPCRLLISTNSAPVRAGTPGKRISVRISSAAIAVVSSPVKK